jgi:hypothetical protein
MGFYFQTSWQYLVLLLDEVDRPCRPAVLPKTGMNFPYPWLEREIN